MTPPSIPASLDTATGDVYVPPRHYAADGSLRECEPIELAGRGRLAAYTVMGEAWYGLVDLDREVRVQVRLGDGPHQVGDNYQVQPAEEGAERVFHRSE